MKRLIHNGIIIPKYEPRGLHIRFKGKPIKLGPLQEEMALAWAKKIGTDYVNDPVFIKNFSADFLRAMNIMDAIFKDFDFGPIRKLLDKEKEAKANLPKWKKKALREKKKKEKEFNKQKYGFAMVDGKKVEIAGYRAEPAGIFMGRGKHPLRGKWKPAVLASEITLNLSSDAPMPPGFVKREFDEGGMWIAKWQNNRKYIWLADTSEVKQKSDIKKFNQAEKLRKEINKVRFHIFQSLTSKNLKRRKVATCCYLIDKLKLRVGDEKGTDEADTVGATTLRPEHIKFNFDDVEFKFIGKDGVGWHKKVQLPGEVETNIRVFIKEGNGVIFKGINSLDVTAFLKESMPELTAKVFRTFHATMTAKRYLEENKVPRFASDYKKKHVAKMANLAAAIECNHKRKMPKTWQQSLENKEARLRKYLAEGKVKKADKLKTEIDLQLKTKEYNLNTSLRSYLDPRVFMKWAKKKEYDWKKIYPKTLQRKFSWAAKEEGLN